MTNKGFGTQALLWIVLAGSVVAGGCVVIEEPARTSQAREDQVHRTGTRLPTGGQPVGAVSKEEWERANMGRVEVGNKPGM